MTRKLLGIRMKLLQNVTKKNRSVVHKATTQKILDLSSLK
jgi:uncharacterized membrane-anchored protein